MIDPRTDAIIVMAMVVIILYGYSTLARISENREAKRQNEFRERVLSTENTNDWRNVWDEALKASKSKAGLGFSVIPVANDPAIDNHMRVLIGREYVHRLLAGDGTGDSVFKDSDAFRNAYEHMILFTNLTLNEKERKEIEARVEARLEARKSGTSVAG